MWTIDEPTASLSAAISAVAWMPILFNLVNVVSDEWPPNNATDHHQDVHRAMETFDGVRLEIVKWPLPRDKRAFIAIKKK